MDCPKCGSDDITVKEYECNKCGNTYKEPTCVAIFSGGLDSTVLLHLLKAKGEEPIALTVNYGQRHDKEIEYAQKTTTMLGVSHIILDLPISKYLQSSALLDKEKSMPHDHYSHENQKLTVVPNRNMILLAVAGAIAEDHGLKKVYYGAHSNDRAVYPDCRPEFVESASRTLWLATYNQVEIVAPFFDKTKAEVVKLGGELGVPFENTWSCYEGKEHPCGKCGTCQERIEAFALNDIRDPLDYGIPWEELFPKAQLEKVVKE